MVRKTDTANNKAHRNAFLRLCSLKKIGDQDRLRINCAMKRK